MKHLNTTTQGIVQLSDQERIKYTLQEKWIGYPKAKTIYDKLDDLMNHPITNRMPNMLLVGETNNGKTAILKRFAKKNDAYIDSRTSLLVAPVVYVQAPPLPEEKRLYNNLLDTLQAPYKLSEKVEKKQQQVIHLLRKVDAKMLIIDEIQHVLAGNMGKQRLFLNVIKYLGNELNIPIVCAGIKTALNAIQTDDQLSNRFNPVSLSKWTLSDDYFRLLASLESIMPLKKESNLTDDEIAMSILNLSEGTIGEIMTVVQQATIYAIKTNKEFIDKKILSEIDYLSPSERKKESKRI